MVASPLHVFRLFLHQKNKGGTYSLVVYVHIYIYIRVYTCAQLAPQVIRKIRGEPFPDASGHLKLWCQFFNVLIDSTIKWYRDEEEILELKRR